MLLSNLSVRRRVAMSTVIIVMVIFGVLGYRKMGLGLTPNIDVPYVTIVTVYPGASPREIETDVARKIEDAVSLIDGVKHLDSVCMESVCQTMIEFEMNRNVDIAAMDVREKIDLIKNDLPADAELPKILKFDFNATPIVSMALTGSVPFPDLYDFADTRLKDALSVLSGVASVDIIGGAKREVEVLIDRERLSAAGMTALDVVRKIAETNVKIPSGNIREAEREIAVTVDAESKTVEELASMELASSDGRRIHLRDVAEVRLGSKEVKSASLYNGKPCITLKVVKKGEANTVKVVNMVHQAYEQLRKELPGGMELNWFRDDGAFVQASVADTWSSILMGMLLTAIILLVFLEDWRMAAISFVSLPVSIIITFAGMRWFGYTLDIVTLLAMGVSVGTLVTNSILVLESIMLWRSRKSKLQEAVMGGADEVAIPVTASAMTNVVVFVPIGLMTSVVGLIFAPFAITITIATLVSLWVSFTLTPILAVYFLGRFERSVGAVRRILNPLERLYRWIENGYAVSLRRSVRYRGLIIAGTLLLFLLTLFLVAPRLGMDFMPEMDKGELTARLEYPTDFNLTETTRRATDVAARLGKLHDVTATLTQVGKVQGILGKASEGPYLAEVNVVCTPKTKRNRPLEDIRAEIRNVLASETACETAVLIPSPIGGASKPIEANITGPDLDVLNDIGLQAARLASDSGTTREVEHTVRIGKPEIQLKPDQSAINDARLSVKALGLTMRGNIEGIVASSYKIGDRSYDVRVKMSEQRGTSQVGEFNLPSTDGKPVSVTAVANLDMGVTPIQITRSGKQRVVKLYANQSPGTALGTAKTKIEEAVIPILPTGYRLQFVNMIEKMGDAVAEFGLAIVIAIILTYLLLAALLESWTQPLLVMTTLPLGFMGMILGLFVAGMSMSIFGLLAGVMLIGIVVNNAILVVDTVNVLVREKGMSKSDAIVKAATDEFRPILMISLASILGMLPMALGRGLGSEMRASCGVGAVGGLVVASLLSLYFVPLFYMMFAGKEVSDERNNPRGDEHGTREEAKEGPVPTQD